MRAKQAAMEMTASAVYRMLQEVEKICPEIDTLTIWSDSCIPQNKNSIMSTAITHFLLNQTKISTVQQKFVEPGHSAVQEVDNIHSQIERRLKTMEINSPVALLKALQTVNIKNPFLVLQLRQFLDFHTVAKKTNLAAIPYNKVRIIQCFVYFSFFYCQQMVGSDS